ncbi:adenosylmethionine--8-amino-7-oxononanoate transaminase [Deminuibacter soli]|uniref:Adenosylmethionine-8-amino-7-oxononanoate aminotransferase n=1 Tax=Deminuibacter soli TaxID=2291815 RepID=A0A3E1NH16_9BACT|nr:adenosylmethionine--8-amino-7-oxononanoate transaminase [Deminuibacter soli]RFM27225.1 adenosylmethionine--8-amino-7-oxononanoate transaminase [Deminuibacter soli]
MNLTERDKQYIWHPFTPQKNMPVPMPVASAKGTLLYDTDGNAYIDAISSWWVTIHGHAHPYIAGQLYKQALTLEQVIFAGFTHEPAVSLAEKLLQLLPGNFSKVFYSDNGSTATEVSLKMAVQYWWNKEQRQRKKIIALKNSYHGDTFGAMSVSDRSVFTLAFHDLLFEVLFIDAPAPENIADSIALLQQHSNETAAIIYEPLIQGAGGLKMYNAASLNQLLAAAKEAGILCIADEVMTGFGRTGKLFASEYINIKPDIICLSKGLTGGTMPLGVTACTDVIYQAYVQDDQLKTFFHGHSFTANPLACTAALASLHLLQQPGAMERIDSIVQSHRQFATTITGHPHIKNLRQLGTILAFEINKGKDEYLNNISQTITAQCLQEGVYLRPLGNTVYLMPPYCITADELSKVYETVRKVIA